MLCSLKMFKKHIENRVISFTSNARILGSVNFAKVDKDQGMEALLGTLFFIIAVTKITFRTNRESWECSGD